MYEKRRRRTTLDIGAQRFKTVFGSFVLKFCDTNTLDNYFGNFPRITTEYRGTI